MALDASVLEDPMRPEDERDQDEGRDAIAVYEFFEVQPGQTVADLWSSAGYNTHVLSRLMGEDGQVYSLTGFYSEFREGEIAAALRKRVEESELDNVMVVDTFEEIPADSLDVAVAVRNYHDVEWVFEGATRTDTVAAIYRIVRPGGIVGIVEVATDREGWDEETHRLNEQVVIDDFASAGFEFIGSSDVLRNVDDDHSMTGFETGRHTTDRYVLKFRKPEM